VRRARGFGLLEIMIAASILLIAVIGFVGAVREAVNATAVAHRRTEATLLRTGLVERLTVARRDVIVPIAGQGWLLESCYDVDARPTGDNSSTWSTTFSCPTGTQYRRYVSAAAVPGAGGIDQRVWSVNLYVERVDQGCSPATRYQSLGCVGADLYLTD
jgi:type II secretory pathway pseudopilin PulG